MERKIALLQGKPWTGWTSAFQIRDRIDLLSSPSHLGKPQVSVSDGRFEVLCQSVSKRYVHFWREDKSIRRVEAIGRASRQKSVGCSRCIANFLETRDGHVPLQITHSELEHAAQAPSRRVSDSRESKSRSMELIDGSELISQFEHIRRADGYGCRVDIDRIGKSGVLVSDEPLGAGIAVFEPKPFEQDVSTLDIRIGVG